MKTIEYKGRVVFQKIQLSSFKRIERMHYENEACFAFVKRGEYKVRDQNQLVDVNPSTALLAKCMNYFYESKDYPKESHCDDEAIGVFLYPEIYQNLFEFDFSKSQHTVDYNLKQIQVDSLLTHYRNGIDVLLDSPELADEFLIENKLRELVILMAKKVNAPSEMDFLASIFKPTYAKLEEVIKANLYADLSLDELAALSHMSLSTFKRKFKEIYNESPKKYVNRQKIEKAKALLKLNQYRISDIVFEVGFDSIPTFNRAFKLQTGQSPTEFKNSQIAPVYQMGTAKNSH